jgi:site-specific DNA-cytosine methylase
MNFGTFPAGDITETPTSTVPGSSSSSRGVNGGGGGGDGGDGSSAAYELLTAGFPCQSFCKAGLKTGLNDARGELFYEVLRFVAAHRPPALLLENVPHLVKIDDGEALGTILAEVCNSSSSSTKKLSIFSI